MQLNITLFTDGASKGNPGFGGWAAIIVLHSESKEENKIFEIGAPVSRATNNQMELLAAIEGLKKIASVSASKNVKEIVVHSDSRYLINGATKWLSNWKKRNWQTVTKHPVENKDLWEQLDEVMGLLFNKNVKINWQYVGGHIGIRGNERCDEIASAFASGEMISLYEGDFSRYTMQDILSVKHDESAQVKKKDTRSRQKTAAYSYVSAVDGVIQIHATWAECEARVKGKPARFKKALSKEEEAAIVSEFSL